MATPRIIPSRILLPLLGMLPTLALSAPAEAQSSERTFTACWVPEVGVVYLIREAGLAEDCLSEAHEEFSWTEGTGGTPELIEGSVTTDVLADASVTAEKLRADAVSSEKIAPRSIASDDLALGAVGAEELADDAVAEAKLADGAVTAPKIEDGAVASSHIADGAVATADLDPDVITARALVYVNGIPATPTLSRHRNAVSVVRSPGFPAGAYEITFASSVGLGYIAATALGGGYTVGLTIQSNNVVRVLIRNESSAYADTAFFLIAF
jgi:hypothetical protein